jgi:hypothetical protein
MLQAVITAQGFFSLGILLVLLQATWLGTFEENSYTVSL